MDSFLLIRNGGSKIKQKHKSVSVSECGFARIFDHLTRDSLVGSKFLFQVWISMVRMFEIVPVFSGHKRQILETFHPPRSDDSCEFHFERNLRLFEQSVRIHSQLFGLVDSFKDVQKITEIRNKILVTRPTIRDELINSCLNRRKLECVKISKD